MSDSNTGYHNTGHHNTGNWNTGHRNTGYFCEQDGPVMFFDLPCDMTREDADEAVPYIDLPCGAEWIAFGDMADQAKVDNPNAEHAGGYLKKYEMPYTESFPLAWAKLDEDERARWTSLPNFDADKFERITGVRVGVEPSQSGPREIVIDGITYVPKD